MKNFKGFREKKIEDLNHGLNILIGDNDTGKSTILLAIELVLASNPKKVETIGLDRLLNQSAVSEFLQSSTRTFHDLPILEVDVYLEKFGAFEFEGEHNLDRIYDCGMVLQCRPRDDLQSDIEQLIKQPNIAFPYEYYATSIKTFSGKTASPYNRPLQHLSIDNTKISNDYASKAYVRSVYNANSTLDEQNKLKHEYRTAKSDFSKKHLSAINTKIGSEYDFTVKNDVSANLETDLTIARDGVEIENSGIGTQCFVRTEFALSKKANIDVILLEEPENHLSHTKMRKLIENIRDASQSQVFVATHSSLVCAGLGLQSAILLGKPDQSPIRLNSLSQSTADYFMKAPSSAVLEFVVSKANILVEGDAEYILMPTLFERVTGESLESSHINLISIGGLSFPRYLEIAELLNIRTAVVTDNDTDPQSNCVDRYAQFSTSSNIAIFYDGNPKRYTFEICMYQDNMSICDSLFSSGRRSLSVQDYMLKNKSDSSFSLATHHGDSLIPPNYISDAIQWVMK